MKEEERAMNYSPIFSTSLIHCRVFFRLYTMDVFQVSLRCREHFLTSYLKVIVLNGY